MVRAIGVVLVVGGCMGAGGVNQGGGGSARTQPASACDANGTWTLDHKLGGADSFCQGEAGSTFRNEMQIVHRANGDANALHNPDTDEVSVDVRDVGGDCVLEITWTANVIAHGTPDFMRYRYSLMERGGRVSGSGTVEGLADDPAGPPRCSQPFTITGSVRR